MFREHGVGQASTVVDLGAGTGSLTLAAAPHVGRVVAVDVSPAMLAVLSDLVRNPTFPQDEIGLLKANTTQSLEAQLASPQYLANRAFRQRAQDRPEREAAFAGAAPVRIVEVDVGDKSRG